jgi:hypothetical protein
LATLLVVMTLQRVHSNHYELDSTLRSIYAG